MSQDSRFADLKDHAERWAAFDIPATDAQCKALAAVLTDEEVLDLIMDTKPFVQDEAAEMLSERSDHLTEVI